MVAEALQPALFLHFALSFPEERFKKLRRRWLLPLVYAPGAGLLALWLWSIGTREATKLLLDRLDQIATGYVAVFYILAALLFLRSYSRATTPLLRQQLKWVTRGTLLAVSAIHALLRDSLPAAAQSAATADQSGRPLAGVFAAHVRLGHRALPADGHGPDLQARRGLHAGHGRCLSAATSASSRSSPCWCTTPCRRRCASGAWCSPFVTTAAIFDPLKRRIQGWVDRAFDRHRYDYRKALVEFGRGLSSETDLQALLNAIVEQLPRTLLVARVAIFLSGESGSLRLAASHGLPEEIQPKTRRARSNLDLGFLNFDRATDHSHIFFENAQQALHLPAEQQRTAALLDLNYYLPCRVAESSPAKATARRSALPASGCLRSRNGGAAGRTIAVIGLGRTLGGDFLSSEDVELLESLASYIGIALQNASLYARLEEKIVEFERLKEFNENIVESINVGIFAIDLERPHRKLERADGGHVRAEPRRGPRPGTWFRISFGVHRGAGRLPQRARACITSTSSA